MGCHRPYINRIENSVTVPAMRHFLRFANAVDVEPAHLIRMTEFLELGV